MSVKRRDVPNKLRDSVNAAAVTSVAVGTPALVTHCAAEYVTVVYVYDVDDTRVINPALDASVLRKSSALVYVSPESEHCLSVDDDTHCAAVSGRSAYDGG